MEKVKWLRAIKTPTPPSSEHPTNETREICKYKYLNTMSHIIVIFIYLLVYKYKIVPQTPQRLVFAK